MLTTIDAHAERRLLCPDPWRVALMLLKHGERRACKTVGARWIGFSGWTISQNKNQMRLGRIDRKGHQWFSFDIPYDSQLGRAILAAWDEVKP